MAIKMLNEGCTFDQITHACKISPNTLSAIKKKLTGERPSEPMHTKAYRLFETKQPYEVALELGLTQLEVSKYYSGYRILKGLDDLSFLYNTLGYKSIAQLKSLHAALTQKGVLPVQYTTFIRMADNINNLRLEEEKLMKQNLNTREHSFDLEEENLRLLWQNDDLKQTKEEMNAEIDQLRSEREHSETAVSENLAKINNLEQQEIEMTEYICNLQIEVDIKESEKKKLEVAANLWQINYNSVVRILIEDIEMYVYEAILEGAGLKMGKCTVNELLDDDYFKNFLRHLLKEPLSLENIESLIHTT